MKLLKMISVVLLLAGSLFGCLVLFTAVLCLIANDWESFGYIWDGINFLIWGILFTGSLVVYVTVSIIQHWRHAKEEYSIVSKRFGEDQEEKEEAREWFDDRVERGDVGDTLENFKERY